MIERAVLLGPVIESSQWLGSMLSRHKLVGADLRVGVDGGNRFWIEQRIPPQIMIGDWDSWDVNPEKNPDRPEYEGAQILTLPRRKDRSDLFYALRLMKSLEVQEVLCLGFTGGRPDHQLSNLMEFAQFARDQKVAAIGEEAEYYWVSPATPLELRPGKGRTVSVFAWPAARGATGVSMEGLQYSLKNKDLKPSSRGLSNIARKELVSVSLKRGLLLVVVPRGEK